MPARKKDSFPARETAEGLVVTVRLTPKSACEGVTGLETDADGMAFLTARVKAVPEKGRANAALAALMGSWLGIPKSRCEVAAGGKSRLKQVLMRGDPALIAERLKERLAELQAGE